MVLAWLCPSTRKDAGLSREHGVGRMQCATKFAIRPNIAAFGFRAKQRLAASKSQFINTCCSNHGNESHDFFERQDFIARFELHKLVGHAVKTADIAAVRDARGSIRSLQVAGIVRVRLGTWCARNFVSFS